MLQKKQSGNISAFFHLIFRHFLMLLIVTALGAGIGFGLSYLPSTKWKSEAQFERPRLLDLGNYYALFSTYSFLTGGDNVAYYVVKDDEGSLALAPEVSNKAEDLALDGAYKEFIISLTAPDTLLSFLSQTDAVKAKAQVENQPIPVVAGKMTEQFVFQKASKSTPFDRLSVVSENPEEATKLLKEFIDYANQHARNNLNRELGTKWKILFQQIKIASEIKLGPTRQDSQITTQDWKGKLGLMRSVQSLDDKLLAYRFVKEPSIPYVPDSPNRQFWVTIGALTGLLFGMMVSSIIGLFRRKQRHG